MRKGSKMTDYMTPEQIESWKKNHIISMEAAWVANRKPKSDQHKKNLSKSLKGKYTGEHALYWKGDSVKYSGLHMWLRRNKPKPDACEKCGATGRLEIANLKKHNYSRCLDDYMYLCVKCHRDLDGSVVNLTHNHKVNP